MRLSPLRTSGRYFCATVQRLHHHLAPLLGQERPQPPGLARDDGGRREMREIQHRQLLVGIAQPARVVDDDGLSARALEQQRREVIVHVEGRVLAHQHGLAAAQRHQRLRAQQVVVAGHTADRHRPGARHGVGVLQAQVARLAEPDLVVARLRRQHERERRIARDLQAGERIHHEEHLHGRHLIVAAIGSARPPRRQPPPPARPRRRPAPPSWAGGAQARACAAGSKGSIG
jgi:hypothetical protein